YCMAKTLVPRKCPLCSKSMTMIGVGSQRLEEELAKKLPDARIARVDSDAMAGKAAGYYKLLGDFAAGRIDILAGTQMLAKGLHFPNVTLVGVISADTALSLPDFRANERTFQLLSQVAGRAGRSEKGGEVIVQTFLTGQPAIDFALKHDYEGFVAEEMGHRRKCNLPPCGKMAIVRLKDGNYDKLTAASEAMRAMIDDVADYKGLKLTVRGPMEAAINRIGGFHRMQIIVQADDVRPIQELFAAIRTGASVRPAVTIGVDVDPVNLM
ncbi:MAG TPA: primosomal protein N', partial [Phycisphaerales bacterium]|nr:primosomal protein N' [Phycisphaerales bacterium]